MSYLEAQPGQAVARTSARNKSGDEIGDDMAGERVAAALIAGGILVTVNLAADGETTVDIRRAPKAGEALGDDDSILARMRYRVAKDRVRVRRKFPPKGA